MREHVKQAKALHGTNKWRVNGFYGAYPHELLAGCEPSEVRQVFTAGNCHSFALAVSKLTGWPLAAIFRREDTDEIASHVFCQKPDGNYFDVNGTQSAEDIESQFRGEIKPINKWHLRAWNRAWNRTQCGYIPTRVKDAIPYAKRALARD